MMCLTVLDEMVPVNRVVRVMSVANQLTLRTFLLVILDSIGRLYAEVGLLQLFSSGLWTNKPLLALQSH